MRWVGANPTLVSAYHVVLEQAVLFGVRDEEDLDVESLRADWTLVQAVPLARLILVHLLAVINDGSVPSLIQSIPDMKDDEFLMYLPLNLSYQNPQQTLRLTESISLDENPWTASCVAMLLALDPEKQSESKKLCIELLKRNQGGLACLHTLLILGERAKVRDLAMLMPEGSSRMPWYGAESIEFLADVDADVDEYLADAMDVASHRVVAEFTVALVRLSEGEREMAVAHLQRAVDSRGGTF